ncbi:MAG: hypothetical protein LBC07_04895, partial [Elusimicrobiota bacterium]|nr:hypothetical protein [Elusimicrobiota bacterium]
NFQNGILIKVYQYKDYFNLLVQVIDAAAFKAYNADRLAQRGGRVNPNGVRQKPDLAAIKL